MRNITILGLALGLVLSSFGQTYGGGIIDIDGNEYQTVIIGGQEWMAKNLSTSKYANGDAINESGIEWSWYDNDSSNDSLYGKLYSWSAVEDVRNICPSGWHVPSDSEWTALANYLAADGYCNKEGFALKAINFNDNGYGRDDYGFKGIAGGYEYNNSFSQFGVAAVFWSASNNSNMVPYYFINTRDSLYRGTSSTDWDWKISVRCLIDTVLTDYADTIYQVICDSAVHGDLTASFTADSTTIGAGETVSFTNTSAGNIQAYQWNISGGDYEYVNGTSSSSEDIVVRFNEGGIFSVYLTTIDGFNAPATSLTTTITVQPLTASFTADSTTIAAGETLSFTNTSAGNIQAYQWNISGGDYEYVNGTSSSSEDIDVQFNEGGIFSVYLTTIDGANPNVTSVTATISVIKTLQKSYYSKFYQNDGWILDAGWQYGGNPSGTYSRHIETVSTNDGSEWVMFDADKLYDQSSDITGGSISMLSPINLSSNTNTYISFRYNTKNYNDSLLLEYSTDFDNWNTITNITSDLELNQNTENPAGAMVSVSFLDGTPKVWFRIRYATSPEKGLGYAVTISNFSIGEFFMEDIDIPWNENIEYGSVSDIDGNEYRTVTIGNREWMAENLRVTLLNDSSQFPLVYLGWFADNDIDSIFGKVYSLSIINNEDYNNICPSGWHIPSKEDWGKLKSIIELDGQSPIALKSFEGWKNNASGTDVYGFRALPFYKGSSGPIDTIGLSNSSNGNVAGMVGMVANWWSEGEMSNYGGTWNVRYVLNNEHQLYPSEVYNNEDYYPIRCIKAFDCDTTLRSSYDTSACHNFISQNGTALFESGIIVDSFITLNGCDSIVTINVSITNSRVSNDTTTFIVSSDNYDGHISLIDSLGIDSLVQVSNGCDSLVYRYEKYIYQQNFYRDTTEVYDTTYISDTTIVTETINDTNVIYDSITLYDTITAIDTFFVIDTTIVTETINDTNVVYDIIDLYDTIYISVEDTLNIILSISTGTDEIEDKLKVWSDGASIFFDSSTQEGYAFELISILGSTVLEVADTYSTNMVSLSGIATGTYIAKFTSLTDSGATTTKKIVIR
jgi:uncharacterized protein (TIGR02145 family)